MHQEPVAITKRILDCFLIFGTLHVLQLIFPECTQIGGVAERRRRIRSGDVVAQLSQIIPAQPMTTPVRGQPEMLPQLLTEILGRQVRMVSPR